MKKIIFSFPNIAALLVAGAALVACSEKNLNVVEEIPEFTYSVSVDAIKGEGADTVASTRALTLEGSTLSAGWLTTENVYVKKGSEWASEGTLKPQANGTSAILKGSVTVTGSPIVATDELFLQFPKSGEPDYAGQKGTIADIAANFDYATATVTVDEVNGETGILTTTAANFVNQQAIVEFVLTNRSTDANLNVETLTITAGGNEITVGPDSATNDLYVAIPGFSGGAFDLSANDGSNDYYFSTASFPYTLANGSFYQLPVKLRPVPQIRLTSSASVSLTKQSHSNQTITYNVVNPKDGDNVTTSAISYSGDGSGWITISGTTNTTLTYGVDQYKGNTSRTGVITLNYPHAASVQVTITQAK